MSGRRTTIRERRPLFHFNLHFISQGWQPARSIDAAPPEVLTTCSRGLLD